MGIMATKRLALETCRLENALLMLRMKLTFVHKFPRDETLGSLKPMLCCHIGGWNSAIFANVRDIQSKALYHAICSSRSIRPEEFVSSSIGVPT